MPQPLISFVGAGPGAADLLTLRGADRLAAADVVVWAASLVPRELLVHCRDDVELHDSSTMTLEDVTAVYGHHGDVRIVRLHSGDPTIYSAIAEQIAWCQANDRPYEIVPGVSSVSATAAAVGRELTVPGVAQSVVLTRLAHRTKASVPAEESLAARARQGGTMALFLSAARPEALQAELLAEGSAYGPDTPTVIGYRVSWPDEQIRTGTVRTLTEDIALLGQRASVLILVGDALTDADPPARSHVYAADYGHAFRPASGTPAP